MQLPSLKIDQEIADHPQTPLGTPFHTIATNGHQTTTITVNLSHPNGHLTLAEIAEALEIPLTIQQRS